MPLGRLFPVSCFLFSVKKTYVVWFLFFK